MNEEGKRRHQSIVGATMYLAQVSRFNILYAVNRRESAGTVISKPSEAHMGAAKLFLCYWARSTDFYST